MTVLALSLLAAVPAHADDLAVIPISGTATYDSDWRVSLTGPSLSFSGGELHDAHIFTQCAAGTLCDLSDEISIANCGIIACDAVFDGQTSDVVKGTLTVEAATIVPFSDTIAFVTVTEPAIVYGQLFGMDCSSIDLTNCVSAPSLFGFNILGSGTVTFSVIEDFGEPTVDAITDLHYSFSGIAVETPEPPGALLSLTGLIILGLSLKFVEVK